MLFPESQRVIYSNNPLAEVICQLRFPPILEISSEKPSGFQNKIRSKYPLYESGDNPSVPEEISQMITQFKLPGISEAPIHKFLTENSKSYISLNQGFLALTTREYHRWEDFLVEIKNAQNAHEQEYQPAFYSRIGLRYQDVIDRKEFGLGNEPWKNLINRNLVGMLGIDNIYTHVQEMWSTSILSIDEVKGGLFKLRHGLGKDKENKEVYVIDADFFTTERSQSADVASTLGIFNRLAGNFFRWAITGHLQEALGPTPIN